MATKKTEQIYTVSLHILPSLSDEESEKVFTAVKDTLESAGEVLSVDALQKTALAYTIQHTERSDDGVYEKYDEAWFGSIKFRSPRTYVQTLHTDLQKNTSVLRHLILETVAEDTRISTAADEESETEKEYDTLNNTAQYQI